MKKSIVGALLLVLAFSLIGCTKEAEEPTSQESEPTVTQVAAEVEETEETKGIEEEMVLGAEADAFILYSYCHKDGNILKGESSETIEVVTEDNKITYNFKEHVLSCGTHMNGTITEETEEGVLIVKASFEVTQNSYKINGLVVDYTKNLDTYEYEGTLTVNSKTLDINRFY